MACLRVRARRALIDQGSSTARASKPVIICVDDDAEVLGAVERDLRRHFQADYRILKARSGAEGLEAARQLKQRGTPVALFLVDQRMPAMQGTEFLREAMKLHPEARKVLLTAYADTEAAISSINEIGLDHYLIKPWDPPAERLYPVLDDLLGDWSARCGCPMKESASPERAGRRRALPPRNSCRATRSPISGSTSRTMPR